MGEEVTTEVVDKSGKFVPFKNKKINEMKKYHLYAEILQRGIK